ncbi:hypothetical protein KFL_003350010 [Klebsormidium nitens]|uniref:Uncharacterized protein n=1 Tax=Klebsormidium nitens TaxID=105231 RepID=A0A0U9HL36_KLENI|nr:hypothetical protein KFL_003350010 [Klebsormidium nitens]|eukprot:GAQ87151.1 hypothetical protein KFL_003350010 [Klebsormidium nitens]
MCKMCRNELYKSLSLRRQAFAGHAVAPRAERLCQSCNKVKKAGEFHADVWWELLFVEYQRWWRVQLNKEKWIRDQVLTLVYALCGSTVELGYAPGALAPISHDCGQQKSLPVLLMAYKRCRREDKCQPPTRPRLKERASPGREVEGADTV